MNNRRDEFLLRMSAIHETLMPARRTVPTELIGLGLIYNAQAMMHGADDGCFICARSGNLVEDHCHATGQVRAFLCRSCNALEGFGTDESLWSAYRAMAPGVGLHVYYRERDWAFRKWPDVPRHKWPATVLNYREQATEFLEWAAHAPSPTVTP